MRYVVLLLTSLICFFFNSAVLPQAAIFGIQMDIMLAAMVCMVMLERTMTPVFYMTGCAVIMDCLFATAIGYYSLPYLLIGLLLYLVMWKWGSGNVKWYAVPILGGGAWLIKEILSALFSVLLGVSVDLGRTFLSHSVPVILLAALLTSLLYLLFARLYRYNFLRPLSARQEDEYRL